MFTSRYSNGGEDIDTCPWPASSNEGCIKFFFIISLRLYSVVYSIDSFPSLNLDGESIFCYSPL